MAKGKSMAKKTTLVIHHTYSNWGDVAEIDRWHKQRGWSGIGYHKMILNDYPSYSSWSKRKPVQGADGKICDGRKPETSVAAGVHPNDHPTRNRDGIHISLVGNFDVGPPSDRQWATLVDACARLCQRHGINSNQIWYHRDFADKSCPGKKFPNRTTLRKAVHNRIVEIS